MPTVLPAALFLTTLSHLELSDENTILQRLYDRDEALLTDLLILQQTRDDFTDQFQRLADLEGRFNDLNQTIDNIIRTFYQDLDGDGDPLNNVTYFVNLIADLQATIGHAEALSADIIRFDDIQALLAPVGAKLAQLDDLDELIRTKLSYIYGKWDINPADDILSV